MTVICSLVSFLVGCAVALIVVALCQANHPTPDYERFHTKFRKWQNN